MRDFLIRLGIAIFLGLTLSIGCVIVADRATDAALDAACDFLEADAGAD